jgi:hypothetical protein
VKLLVFSLGLNPGLQVWAFFSCGWSVGQAVRFLFRFKPWASGVGVLFV